MALALVSGFFCVLGLGLEPCVLNSTSDNIDPGCPGPFNLMFVNQFKRLTRVKLSVFTLKVAEAIGVARIFDWGGPKSSKIRLSSPKLRVIFQPKSEIRTIFSPKIR